MEHHLSGIEKGPSQGLDLLYKMRQSFPPKTGGLMVWVVGIGFFLLLLFLFPRQVGILVLCVIGLAGAVGSYFHIQEKVAEKQRAKVNAVVSFGSSCADPEFPISAEFTNGTGKTLEKIWFTLVAKRSGYSSDVYSTYLSTDKIIAPGGTYAACWRLASYDLEYGRLKGQDLGSLEWSAKVSSLNFAD